MWGDKESVAEKVRKGRLGHLAHMPDHTIPKSALFRFASSTISKMWPVERCAEEEKLKDECYKESRPVWRAMCRLGLGLTLQFQCHLGLQLKTWSVKCVVEGFGKRATGRGISVSERSKPVSEERGAAQC